jgi:hypothetical protein
VEFEPMEELERELRQALKRQPAPPGLKRKVMARRIEPARRQALPWFIWRGLAASIVSVSLCILVALAIYRGYEQREAEQRRQAEAIRQQVLTALRITNHAFEHMNKQLEAHGHAGQE